MPEAAVSVLMLAHNHGEFIREAIESVLTQKTDRKIELLIGEDASRDGTLAVCREFAARYPDVIRLFSHGENIGMHANFAHLWRQAQNEYIAFCEGDDFWCDDEKLSLQAAFLDKNPDCNLCGAFTRVIAQGQDGAWRETGIMKPSALKARYTFEDLIGDYGFHFSSVMLRKSPVEFPAWFSSMYCVDRPLYLLAAQHGGAGAVDRVLSVYRIHPGGNWSSIDTAKKAERSISLFTTFIRHFGPEHGRSFRETLADILWFYMSEDLMAGRMREARSMFWKSLRWSTPGFVARHFLRIGKVFLRLHFPAVDKLRQASQCKKNQCKQSQCKPRQ